MAAQTHKPRTCGREVCTVSACFCCSSPVPCDGAAVERAGLAIREVLKKRKGEATMLELGMAALCAAEAGVQERSQPPSQSACPTCGDGTYCDAIGIVRCIRLAPPGIKAGDDLRPSPGVPQTVFERMHEAVLSAFRKATGEPIVMDAIDTAQRHREALERIAEWDGSGAGTTLGYEGPRDVARKALTNG